MIDIAVVARKELKPISITKNGTQQPVARPIFLCLPCLVSGIPIFFDTFPFNADKPTARFQENDNPGIPFFLDIHSSK